MSCPFPKAPGGVTVNDMLYSIVRGAGAELLRAPGGRSTADLLWSLLCNCGADAAASAGAVSLSVVDGIATFQLGGIPFSWEVTGAGGVFAVSASALRVTVTNGIARLTGGGLDHTFPVSGSANGSIGPFIPSVLNGITTFRRGASTFTFEVSQP